MPLYLARNSRKGDYDECEKLNVLSCVECGSCAYICPGKVPIVQFIRVAKSVVNDRRRAKLLAAQASEKPVQSQPAVKSANETQTPEEPGEAKQTGKSANETQTSENSGEVQAAEVTGSAEKVPGNSGNRKTYEKEGKLINER